MICFPHLPTTSPMSPPPSPCSFCSCHPVVICPPWCFSVRLSTSWFQHVCTRSSLCWTHSSLGELNDLLPHFFQVSARTSFHQRGLPYLKQHSSATLLLPHPRPPALQWSQLISVYCLTSSTVTSSSTKKGIYCFVIAHPQCPEKWKHRVGTQ